MLLASLSSSQGREGSHALNLNSKEWSCIMLNFNPPILYNSTDVVKIFRSIQGYLNSKPFLFQIEGVFRVPGNLTYSMQIIDNILKNNPFISNQYSVNDYIGALKYALTHCELINSQDSDVQQLLEKINSGNTDEGVDAINQFLIQLAHSNDLNKFMACEIIYNYLHLLSHALIFQTRNKMSAENLGIVAGPLFGNLLKCHPNLISMLNNIAANLLSQKMYLNSFEETFSNQIKTMRIVEIKSLEFEREALLKLRDIYADKLLQSQEDIAIDREKLNAKKGKLYLGKFFQEEQLKIAISSKQMKIQILKNDDRVNTLAKLNEIENRLQALKDVDTVPHAQRLLVYSMRRPESTISNRNSVQQNSLQQLAKVKSKTKRRRNKHA